MDPRRKALIEVRQLLEAEGWGPQETQAAIPTWTPLRIIDFRPNLILTIICIAAVATNLILIGANHDLRKASHVIINVSNVYIKFQDRELARKALTGSCFVTIDGKVAWQGDPDRRDLESLVHRGQSNSHPVAINDEGVVYFWRVTGAGHATLVGLSTIPSGLPDGSTIELSCQDEQFVVPVRVFVTLKVEKEQKSELTASNTAYKR